MADQLSAVPFDLDETEEFILYRCGAELTSVIEEVFQRLREAEDQLAILAARLTENATVDKAG